VSDSILYFVRRDRDGAVKIGITTAFARRLADLRRQHGPMTPLGTVVGAATREKLAHLIFDHCRLDGEFFQPTEEVLSFVKKYADPPPIIETPPARAPRATGTRPWIDKYSDPLAVYDRDDFVRDYETWIARGLVSTEKEQKVAIFRTFPEKIVFLPQSGLSRWGWSPLNPRCWTDTKRNRLYT
jgi:T5orf172 domain